MKNLAIVPARGGSKRLPGKNLKPLAGTPLVSYTLNAAVQSQLFEKILLSSDDEEILAIGSDIPGITHHHRDAQLATDTTKVWDLVHAICLQDDVRNTFDTVSLFLPTCPFRTAADIQEAFSLLDEECDGVISISKLRDHVQVAVGYDEDSHLIDAEALLKPSPLLQGQTRSQDFITYYRPNGGIYIKWLEKFIVSKSFFTGKIKATVFDPLKSVDIDTEMDFKYAEYLLENNYVTIP